MKITITFKGSRQISPDDWETYTAVKYFDSSENLQTVYEKLLSIDATDHKKNFNGEIHFEID